ncbi:MAG TPA: response regulator [Cytophagales bacterium]|nr:response regulator [Cytophagales bacterium]
MISSALLIDDDPITTVLNKKLLLKVKNDISVKIESDAREALNYLKEFQPDLIFLDLNMPGMDGLDFIAEYKKLGLESKIIILTTMSVRPTVMEKLKEYDCTDVFLKPLSIENINSCLLPAL